MEPRRQRIFDSNDRRIDVLVGSLEEAGIKDNETLVLVSYLATIIDRFIRLFGYADL